jgi:glutathione S-transferase
MRLMRLTRKALAVHRTRDIVSPKEDRMYTLYARPGAGSAAVEALLALLAVPHDIKDVPKTDAGAAPDWYLAINPRGEIPSLKLPDDSIMTESAAMMIHLADSHAAAGLAPALGTAARAQYLRWMVYLAAAAYPTDLRLYYPDRYSTDASHADAIKAKASADLLRDFDMLARGMGDGGDGPFILGKTMSAVDLYAAMLIAWSDDMPALCVRHPKLQAIYNAVTALPAIRKIWDRNGMP